MSSRVSEWMCMSARPGESHATPLPSTISASAGSVTLLPTAVMRPSRTSTVWSRSTRSRSIGTTLTCTKAMSRAVAGTARQANAIAIADGAMRLTMPRAAPETI